MKTQDNKEQVSHTAGPWKAKRADEFSGVFRIENESGQMQVATVHNYDTDEACKANTELIAAAPDTARKLAEVERMLLIARNERDEAQGEHSLVYKWWEATKKELEAVKVERDEYLLEIKLLNKLLSGDTVALRTERDELKAINGELVDNLNKIAAAGKLAFHAGNESHFHFVQLATEAAIAVLSKYHKP